MEKKKLRDASRLLSDTTLNMTDSVNVQSKASIQLENTLDNSMVRITNNTSKKNQYDVSDDSFLEMERMCNQEDRRFLSSADETLLFDIEPPSELWEQSSFLTLPAVNNVKNQPMLVENSPVKAMGLIRPSTIIEETSSQFSVENHDSVDTKKSPWPASSSLSSSTSTDLSTTSSVITAKSFVEPEVIYVDNNEMKDKPPRKLENYKKRETMVFKKRKYKFFADEDGTVKEETFGSNAKTPTVKRADVVKESENLIDFESPATNKDKTQFNDTLEAMDFFLEEGRRILETEKTPFCDRANQNNTSSRSMIDTPFLSVKRKRILSEMSATPGAKRGPLFEFLSPSDDLVSARK